MQKRLPHGMNKCFEFLPFRSSPVTSFMRSALVSLLTTIANYKTNPRERRVLKKKQAVEYSVIKNMVERQIQYTYTHTHFCHLVLRKHRAKGKTVISPAPIHPKFN